MSCVDFFSSTIEFRDGPEAFGGAAVPSIPPLPVDAFVVAVCAVGVALLDVVDRIIVKLRSSGSVIIPLPLGGAVASPPPAPALLALVTSVLLLLLLPGGGGVAVAPFFFAPPALPFTKWLFVMVKYDGVRWASISCEDDDVEEKDEEDGFGGEEPGVPPLLAFAAVVAAVPRSVTFFVAGGGCGGTLRDAPRLIGHTSPRASGHEVLIC